MNYLGANFDQVSRGLLCPEDYQNPEPKEKYHLVVIGAGPAGLISAIGAAGLGAKVALVEKHLMGGDCLNVGCMPSKALLSHSAQIHSNFDAAFAWLREVRAKIAPHDSVARYLDAGVDVFLGEATFGESGDVMVGGARLAARRIALCTGARADIPNIPGLSACDPLTNETVFDLTRRPRSLAILGAGPIGCELAQVFARLGTGVHLFEMAERVLPNESPRASKALAQALEAAGVRLYLGHPVQEIQGSGTIVTARGQVVCERVLVALGRKPNTETLNLASVGVNTNDRGFVVTDDRLRTSNKSIFAAGDCTHLSHFTHQADAQARALIQNALFFSTAKVDDLVVPHCTYTTPEVASVGMNAEQLEAQNIQFETYEFDLNELDRSVANPQIKSDMPNHAAIFVSKGTDKILGATIVASDAGELLSPIVLMMSNKLGLAAARKTLFSYPTRSEYLKRLADAYNRSRFTQRVADLFAWWLKMTLR